MKRYLPIILALLFAVPAYGQDRQRIRDLTPITAAEITDDTTVLFGTDRTSGSTPYKLSLAELRKKGDVRAVANVAAFASVTADEGQIFITRGYSTAGIGSGIYRYHATGRPTADGVLYFDAAGADDYLELLHNGVIDVTQAGAVAGGTAATNQAAFERALAAAQHIYVPSFGTGRTTYTLNDVLTMTLGQTISGDGPYTSTLQWSSQPDGYAIAMADFCVLDKIGLIGEDAAGKDGISIIDSTRVVVRDVEIQNFNNNLVLEESWIITLQGLTSLSATNAAIRVLDNNHETNALTIIGGDIGTSPYGIQASCSGYNWDIQGLTIQSCTTAGILSDGKGIKTCRCFVYCEANGVNQIHLNATSSDQNWRISGVFSGALSGSDIKITRGVRCIVEPSTFHQSRTHVELGANADQTVIHQSGTEAVQITDGGVDTRTVIGDGSVYLGGLNGTPTIDWKVSTRQDFVINGNITSLSFTAPPIAHTKLILYVKQNATGGYTVNWPTLKTDDPELRTGANEETVIEFYYDGSGYYVLSESADKRPTVSTAGDGDTTPTVFGIDVLIFDNTSSETITDLDDGYNGKQVECHVDGSTTLDDSSGNFKFDSSIGGTFNGGSGGKVITLRLIDGVWTQTGYNVDF